MKQRTPYVLLLLLTLLSLTAMSQNSNGQRPKLFSSFPEKFDCAVSDFNAVFATPDKQEVNLALSANFLFSGTVISNTVKYGNMQTVVIKSAFFENAVFVITKITAADNKVFYKGRIVNANYLDGYELKKDDLNNYQLVKFEIRKLLQDCKQ